MKGKASASKANAKAGKVKHKAEAKAQAKAKTNNKSGLIKAMAKTVGALVSGKEGCIHWMQVDLEDEEEEDREDTDGEEDDEEEDGAPACNKPSVAKPPAALKTPAAAMKRPAGKANVAESKAVIIAFAKSKVAAKNSTSRGAYTTKAYKNMLSLTKCKDQSKAAYKIAGATWDAACA